MWTGHATRPRQTRVISRDSQVARRYVLAAPILLLLHGPAQAAEELIEMAQDDAQWVMPAKNYASTRFSGLDQITTDNVRDLQVAWTFSTGLTPGHEAAPLVVGDTMYVVTPIPTSSTRWIPATAR